jgi:hypothetical protein
VPPKVLFAVLLFFVVCLLGTAEAFWSRRQSRVPASEPPSPSRLSWGSLSVLLLPFLAAYCALLVPRAASTGLFDRYFLEIVAILLIYMLRWHQEHVSPRAPVVSIVTLALVTIVTVAATHDLFSMDRARVRLLDDVQAAGIPRTSIRGGFAFDTITQIDAWGYVNDSHIRNPPGAFKLQPLIYADTNPCRDSLQPFIPAVHPIYAIAADPTPCLGPSSFLPVSYRTWLPPATRELFVGTVLPATQHARTPSR